MHRKWMALALALLLPSCASFDGRGLVPGQSTAAEVQALMGEPAERLVRPDGDAVWYYPRQPIGRKSYAVRLTPAGMLRSIEQLLTEGNLKNLVPGTTTAKRARELLGPPAATSRMERQQRDILEYWMENDDRQDYFLYVQLSYDGIVREVVVLKDYHKEQGDGSHQ
jgi:hypothetical protein